MLKKVLILLMSLMIILGIMVLVDKREIVYSFEDGLIIDVEYGDKFQKIDAKATYQGNWFHFFDKELDITEKGFVNTNKLGQYTIEYYASYKDQRKTQSYTVNIIDTLPPELVLVESDDYYTDYGASYVEEGFSCIDRYDGDLTDSVICEEKDGVIKYTVSDSSGNVTELERIIKYKDMSGPVITLKGSFTNFKVGSSYVEPGFSAIDNKDGDITANVTITNNVNTSKAGVYSVTYSSTDEAGNTTIAKRTVYVYGDNPGFSQNSKIIHLTFDDGPSVNTGKLLEVLDKYNVKATFFVVNFYQSSLGYIAKEAQKGHTVAIHSYTHDYSKIYKSTEAYWDDLNKMKDVIVKYTGKTPNLVRFPGGTSNTVSRSYCKGIMTQLVKELTENGYRYCDWNVSSGDAGEVTTAEAVFKNVITGVQGYNRSFVLQHDSKSYSVDAVEKIIIWGLANGYTFQPITDDTPVTHHRIQN